MLRLRNLITDEEYLKCLKELNINWEDETNKVIDETLRRVLDK